MTVTPYSSSNRINQCSIRNLRRPRITPELISPVGERVSLCKLRHGDISTRQDSLSYWAKAPPHSVPEVCGSPDRWSPVGLGLLVFLGSLCGEEDFHQGLFCHFSECVCPEAVGRGYCAYNTGRAVKYRTEVL